MKIGLLFRVALYAATAALAAGRLPARADDAAAKADPLASVFVAGEDWQAVAEDLGFADGCSCDAEGNVYFCDLKSKPPVVYKVSPDGKKTKIAETGVSGTKIGPDGRLYGCGGGKVVAFELPGGKLTVLAEGVQPNDLVVSHKGHIYFTETGKKQVTFLDPKTGQTRPADVGIAKPNGITLTPDQKTLLVSDYGGVNVWSFHVADDGALTEKKPAMTMRAPENKPDVAGGDGMTTDAEGRAYVTTALGLQIFDAGGALLGVVPKPQNGPLTNVTFGGEKLDWLYVACGTKVFRRKTQAHGVLLFRPPPSK